MSNQNYIQEETNNENKQIRFYSLFKNTIYFVMVERGWKAAESSNCNDWDFTWAMVDTLPDLYDGHVYGHLRKNQFINHFRNHYLITRKDVLTRSLKNARNVFLKLGCKELAAEFELIPPSFMLPYELPVLSNYHNQIPLTERSQVLYIVKPGTAAQGRGIFIVSYPELIVWAKKNFPSSVTVPTPVTQGNTNSSSTPANIASPLSGRSTDSETSNDTGSDSDDSDDPEYVASNGKDSFKNHNNSINVQGLPEAYSNCPYLVSRYISNPLLIAGRKFDLRIYVLVNSFSPILSAWICSEGFARATMKRYSNDNIRDRSAHLTNVAIQKHSSIYDNSANGEGAKWSLSAFKTYLKSLYGAKEVQKMLHKIEMLILRTLQSTSRSIIRHIGSFEIYGFDVLIDDNLVPWLIEVNASPSLSADTAVDLITKKRMLHDAISIIGVDGPSIDQTVNVFGCWDRMYFGEVPDLFSSGSTLSVSSQSRQVVQKWLAIKNVQAREIALRNEFNAGCIHLGISRIGRDTSARAWELQ